LGNGSFPRVSGDKVVFRHGSNLKLYNAETGIISEITNYDGVNGGIGSSRGFDIDGNRVVYNDTSGRIHLINLESGQSEIIAEREGVRKLDPRIDGNKVVWLEVGEESFIYDIALFDLETRTKSIIAENKGISELNFEESKVMYVQSNGEGAGVHFYDLLTGNTEFLGSGHSVSVTGNKFVFIQDNRLKVYDLSNGEAYLVKQRENAWQFRIVWAEVFYPGDGTIVRSVYFGNLE
jgi:WD40 repeat protein